MSVLSVLNAASVLKARRDNLSYGTAPLTWSVVPRQEHNNCAGSKLFYMRSTANPVKTSLKTLTDDRE